MELPAGKISGSDPIESSNTPPPGQPDFMKMTAAEVKAASQAMIDAERESKPIPFPGFTGAIKGKNCLEMTREKFREAERQMTNHKDRTGALSHPTRHISEEQK